MSCAGKPIISPMPLSIAQVVVGLPIAGPFDYVIPESLQEQIRIGSRVYVSFRSKFCVGYVVDLLEKSQFTKLKPLTGVLDNIPTLDEKFLEFTREIANSYACSWGQAIEVALPVVLRSKRQITWQPSLVKRTALKEPQTFFYQGSLQSCAKALAKKIKEEFTQGRGIIFLVPELNQVAVVKDFLEKVCRVAVSVLDRTMGVKRELAEWLTVKEGKAQVLVGTRSAVFAMMPNVGLIVIVDEENMSYRQEQSPCYHAREMAFMRQKHEHCDLLFVGLAPSAELWKILQDKKVQPEVFQDEHLSVLQVVDLANYKYQNMLVSFPLQNAIGETLAKEGKVLLFLNRRGFSTLTKCNQCGGVLKCERCSTILSFLYSKKKLVCHRCSFSQDLPKFCPQCHGSYLRSLGTGIEKLESDLARSYPQASMATFDSKTKVFADKANLMIATAAIIPFLHRAHFSLIAVLDFDGEINRIDFRASSRAFTLLTRLRQAASEKLFVQTRNPQHEAIRAVATMNHEKFYREELKIRRELNLPPFTHVITLVLRGIKQEDVLAQAQIVYEELNAIPQKNFTISLVAPDLIPKLRDKFRYTIMLNGKAVKSMLKEIEPFMQNFKTRKGVIMTIDVGL